MAAFQRQAPISWGYQRPSKLLRADADGVGNEASLSAEKSKGVFGATETAKFLRVCDSNPMFLDAVKGKITAKGMATFKLHFEQQGFSPGEIACKLRRLTG